MRSGPTQMPAKPPRHSPSTRRKSRASQATGASTTRAQRRRPATCSTGSSTRQGRRACGGRGWGRGRGHRRRQGPTHGSRATRERGWERWEVAADPGGLRADGPAWDGPNRPTAVPSGYPALLGRHWAIPGGHRGFALRRTGRTDLDAVSRRTPATAIRPCGTAPSHPPQTQAPIGVPPIRSESPLYLPSR